MTNHDKYDTVILCTAKHSLNDSPLVSVVTLEILPVSVISSETIQCKSETNWTDPEPDVTYSLHYLSTLKVGMISSVKMKSQLLP